MKTITSLILLFAIPLGLLSKNKSPKALLVTSKRYYVISEKVSTPTVGPYIFNSLFIWNDDKVIRILYKEIRKMPLNSYDKMQSFESFLPKVTFKPGAKRNVAGEVAPFQERDFIDDGENYHLKLRSAINGWNKKYNPQADKLETIEISDGNPEVFVKSSLNHGHSINILPIIFKAKNSNQFTLIQPYYINIYVARDNPAKNPLFYKQFGLYSTLSLINDDMVRDFNAARFRRIDEYLTNQTLSNIYSGGQKADIIDRLTSLELAEQKVPFPGKIKLITDTSNNNSTIVKASTRANKKATLLEPACIGYYQYCSTCYDTTYSKADRIRSGCPVRIKIAGFRPIENMSYAFSSQNNYLLKIENGFDFGVLNELEEQTVTENSYAIKWQLLCPGVGYWLANVASANPTGSYSAYNNLLIDEKPIINHK